MFKKIIGTAFFILAFTLLYPLAQILFFVPRDLHEKPSGDCLLILGAKVQKNNTPDLMMKERIGTSLSVIDEEVKAILVSGGTIDTKLSEARVMKDRLKKNGIPGERILMEERSTSTYENFLFTKPLIKKAQCQDLDVISHRFHLPRALMVAHRLGIRIHRLIPAIQKNQDSPERLWREYKAYVWYWLGWAWFDYPS